ncbi:PDZ domain-containing protein [Lacticaseibacillus baoqingensis]|uniref:PDZ domain-containing protein n=1 Tax=Lacticaseibacillus baoqingensis TaxID=2486013 RepID=A0ABW4E262_9LACO|nr:PDZ domain-containing protein [Lacticaseibacillus baoqingensis]
MRLLMTIFGPVTGVGFIIAIFWQWRRLTHERKVFLTAIDRSAMGLWAGLIGGVGSAIVVSLISIGAGLLLPASVLLSLTLLSIVALLLSGLGYAPWWLALAGIVAAPLARWQHWPVTAPSEWAWRLLALIAIVWLINALLLAVIDPPIDVPTIKMGKRGAKIAVYDHRQFYWLPLVMPVSGGMLAALPWWPTLAIGATHFSLIGLPLMLGAALRTKKQLPKHVLRRWAWQYLAAGGVTLLAAIAAWVTPDFAQTWLLILAGSGIILGLVNALTTRGGINYVSQTGTGVRIVAVQPQTPAAKMGLLAGDVVLQCNQLAVHNSAQLYAAIQLHPTYCRLRVSGLDGEIRLCETAIYEGAPHELGMITFAEELE